MSPVFTARHLLFDFGERLTPGMRWMSKSLWSTRDWESDTKGSMLFAYIECKPVLSSAACRGHQQHTKPPQTMIPYDSHAPNQDKPPKDLRHWSKLIPLQCISMIKRPGLWIWFCKRCVDYALVLDGKHVQLQNYPFALQLCSQVKTLGRYKIQFKQHGFKCWMLRNSKFASPPATAHYAWHWIPPFPERRRLSAGIEALKLQSFTKKSSNREAFPTSSEPSWKRNGSLFPVSDEIHGRENKLHGQPCCFVPSRTRAEGILKACQPIVHWCFVLRIFHSWGKPKKPHKNMLIPSNNSVYLEIGHRKNWWFIISSSKAMLIYSQVSDSNRIHPMRLPSHSCTTMRSRKGYLASTPWTPATNSLVLKTAWWIIPRTKNGK